MESRSTSGAVALLLGACLAVGAACGAPVSQANVRDALAGELARRELVLQDLQPVDAESFRGTAAGAGGDVLELRVWLVGREVFYAGASAPASDVAVPVDATAGGSQPRRSISGSFRCDG